MSMRPNNLCSVREPDARNMTKIKRSCVSDRYSSLNRVPLRMVSCVGSYHMRGHHCTSSHPFRCPTVRHDANRDGKHRAAAGVVRAAGSEITPAQMDGLQLGTALRNIGWISFWSQLILSTVSGVVLLFSMGVTSGGAITANPIDVCTLIGVGSGLVTSMLSWTWIRAGRRLGELKEIKLQQCMGTVLASTNLNLVGMGATIIGLQATVGGLVAKTLSSAAAGAFYPRNAPPVAFDVFSVQSCTNTIMSHFVGLVLAQWLLRILKKYIQKEEERASVV